MRRRVVILGSTGSIGENALRVARALADRIEVVGLATRRNAARVVQQAREFSVRRIAVHDPAAAAECRAMVGRGPSVESGEEGLEALAAMPEADVVLCAVVGMAGLRPVVAAIERGRDVALATKEVLVAAGALVSDRARRAGARLLPVDSEHSAIFQCLEHADRAGVRRLLLTASGGPFARRPEADLGAVTVEEALSHPNWSMGRKVTVDSATMMNKGLEIMEAQWLFDMDPARIDVLVHPESIVHSLVEFVDGALVAQLSLPDMRFAIQYALTWPARVDGGLPALDLCDAGVLTFRRPDEKRFPCLALARAAARAGGTMPAVLNAANEVAVEAFLEGRLPFSGIWRTVEAVMGRHAAAPAADLASVMAADAWARAAAKESIC